MSFKGNPEHLIVLQRAIEKNDISIWNNFNYMCRSEGIQADLKGVDLAGNDLTFTNLAGANLEKAYMEECNLEEAYLEETNLHKADLAGVNLRRAYMARANLARANLAGANLAGVNLQRANLVNANLAGVNLRRANLINADMAGAHLVRAYLVNANLEGTLLVKADLSKANLRRANLTGICFYHTQQNNWIIDDIECDYIYMDLTGEKRVPRQRNFEKGEFEEYVNVGKIIDKQLPGIIHEGRDMNHVFISHNTADKNTAVKLKEELEKKGIKVWIERENLQAGVTWKTAIKNAIKNGVYFIACFSDNYNQKKKKYTNEELNIAIDNLRKTPDDQIWFIPVLFSDWKISTIQRKTGLEWADIQWIVLHYDWDEGVQKIIKAIKGS